jgi:hypothetical protein
MDPDTEDVPPDEPAATPANEASGTDEEAPTD